MATTPDAAAVEAVIERLVQLGDDACQRLPLKDNDGLACFDYLYTIITRNILNCVAGAGLRADDPQFHDSHFMSVFDVAFATRYFDGVGQGKQLSWERKSWKVLLDHREKPHISPLIFAVAGVNAHVNFDLPFAVVAACMESEQELGSGTTRDDYDAINKIFAENMQLLRQHFENQFEKGFDKAWVSKVENLLGDVVVVLARDLAWCKAMQLWRVRHDQAKMTRLEKSRDRWVAWVSRGLFELDRIPSMAFKAMHTVPGRPRRMAAAGLARTGHEAKRQNTQPQTTQPAGPKPAGSQSAGSKVAGSKVAGSKVAGSKVAGSKVAGSKLAGSKLAGSKVAGSKVAGSKVAGSKAAGSKAAGSKAAGSKAAGSKAAGSKADGSNVAGSKAAGPKAAGPKPSV